MSPLAGTLYEGLLSQVVNDTALIDALFDRHRCIHAYLDVGTNIGVQIWKIYEPWLYPRYHTLNVGVAPFG